MIHINLKLLQGIHIFYQKLVCRANKYQYCNEKIILLVKHINKLIDDKELLSSFKDYLSSKENLNNIIFKVLRAAHKYSTIREFELISKRNTLMMNLKVEI